MFSGKFFIFDSEISLLAQYLKMVTDVVLNLCKVMQRVKSFAIVLDFWIFGLTESCKMP